MKPCVNKKKVELRVFTFLDKHGNPCRIAPINNVTSDQELAKKASSSAHSLFKSFTTDKDPNTESPNSLVALEEESTPLRARKDSLVLSM